MTIEELLREFALTSNQRDEMLIAYDENASGFERVCRKALNANNPPAALVGMIRKDEHTKNKASKGSEPEVVDLEDCVGIALRLYNARLAKYPPTDERGWTRDDAIIYAVDTAQYRHAKFDSADIERRLRVILGCPWDENSNPALGTGCPPEMPDEKPEPTLKVDANELAQRLLATIGA